ncbi:MAG: helix-turn-helix domain-containing protein [Burkholderiaceae bacterium]|nr:helix-turn-helix domain-containing protein [Sulfuritalea sp.]MCF8173778.1 helix-turn-helix domain-containing protein [Burkholderiaceae bacterium]MCF8184933.1 helix-turn-helix domain-containing protein [Polynucleobacter sp.]
MEKSFLALKSPRAREAYVDAELVNGLAHQIRIIRQERGWTQRQLGEKLGTTQTTVSRLEDPSYGRYSIRSLLALGKVFDVALHVRYLPFSKFMSNTWNTNPENFKVPTYEEELASIQFYSEDDPSYVATLLPSQTTDIYEVNNRVLKDYDTCNYTLVITPDTREFEADLIPAAI